MLQKIILYSMIYLNIYKSEELINLISNCKWLLRALFHKNFKSIGLGLQLGFKVGLGSGQVLGTGVKSEVA